jgi:hypothetical protein
MIRVVLIIALAICPALFAQSPLGSVTGVAMDPSSAPVPGAAVTLSNTRTGVKYEATTNDSGIYNLLNLPPGAYKVSAEAKGFQKIETAEFGVAAFRTIRQDLRFSLQATATEVTVSATATGVIQSETPSINFGLTTSQILNLPTNLRSINNSANNGGDSSVIFTMMPLTIPGISQVGAGAKWLTPGGGSNGTKLRVDGIETIFGNFGSPDPVSQPSIESIEEFTANVMTNRAEFGGIGMITTVTRSGANAYHGNVFWYLRNSALDARNAFAVARPYNNIHNYGVTFSGPIKRDKTFFHFTWDGTKGSRAYLMTANVPTVAMRSGDFTGMAALRNPYTGFNPFDGNKILPQYISSQAGAMQNQYYPMPNFGPPELTAGNYRAAFNGPETHNIYELRMDHNFSSRHSIFGRYQLKFTDYNIPGARQQLPPFAVGTSDNRRRVNFLTLGDVFTLSPALVNEFRGGFVVLSSWSDADLRGQALLDQFGITGLPPRPGAKGIPQLAVTGLTTAGQTLLNPVNDGHTQISDNLSWTKGKHTMKFGGEVIWWYVNRYLPASPGLFGSFSFSNRFTGQPYADFLLGLPTSVLRLDPYPAQYSRWQDYALYAQDDFKVTPRLTLSYGLRYEYNKPVEPRDGNMYSFDTATGSVVIPSESSKQNFSPYFPTTLPVVTAAQVGAGKSLRNGDKNNWAPRFGFSYQLDNSGRTVLRGGWGVYYAHLSANIAGGVAAGPYGVSTTSNNAFVDGRPLYTLADPFAVPGSSGTLNMNGFSTRLLNSYVQQVTVSVERELVRDLGVRLSYIGSKGTQLSYGRNMNQPPASTTPFAQARRPYPVWNNVTYYDNGANSSYNAFQVVVNKRFARSVQFSSSYTWAKSISEIDDTGDFELNTQIENTYDRKRDRADVYSVPRHQWMNQALWELPWMARNPVIGGWQLNALLNASSGNFLNPIFTGIDPSNTNTIGVRPDIAASIHYPEKQSQWYDRSVFTAPPSGRFGTAGRNIIQGPGYVVFNLGFSKYFTMERYGRIQLGASFQNLLNHPNLGEPNLQVNTANGGVITATHVFVPAGSPRTTQLNLRWSF